MTRQDKAEALRKYVNKIRNHRKHEYALAYSIWRLRDPINSISEPNWQCSYMAAQAVRLDIAKIMGA